MTLKIGFYCISGSRAIDRRVNFLNSASRFGWRADFFPAITPPDTYDEFLIFKETLRYRFDSRLVRGEVGCALSHLTLWARLLESDSSHYCIFEDDANFVGGGELLRVVSDVDFQMFNRHSTCYENTSLIGPRSSGLYGYLISRDGASKALSLAKFLDVPIDIFVLKNSLVFGGILKVVVTDTLVDHEGVAPSEIGDLRIIASGRGGAGVK